MSDQDLKEKGAGPIYAAAYDSIRKGAPGLSDATCEVIARAINLKLAGTRPSQAQQQAPVDAQPVRGEIRVIDGNRCRFIERELEGDKWEVIGPSAASDPETHEMAALRAQPQAREDAQPFAWAYRTLPEHPAGASDWVFVQIKPSFPFDHGFERRALHTHPAPDALREKGAELVKALKRYGFPVSGAATVNLGAFGSSEAMAVDFTTREFILALGGA